MHKAFSHCAIVLLCAALAGCGREAAPEENDKIPERPADGPLVLAVMPELPPYAYLDTNTGAICGIDIDIVKAYADYRGITVRMMEEPTPEVLERIKQLDNVVDAQRNGGNEAIVKIKGGAREQEKLFNDIHTTGIRVFSLSEIENSLETIYLDLIKESR